MVTVWVGMYIARFNALRFGLNAFGLMGTNAVVHLIPLVVGVGEYNPGSLTAIFLFLPATYLMFSSMLNDRVCSNGDIVRAIMIGALCHVIIIISLLLLKNGLISGWLACFFQVLNILPLFIAIKH